MGPQIFQQLAVGSINVNAANDIYYRTLCPLQVLQIGFVVSTVIATANATITGDIVRASTGVTTPTGAAALGTLTTTSATMAISTGVWLDVMAVKGNRIVYPGEALRFYTSAGTGSATGIVQVFAIVALLGFNNADMRSHVSGHPGSTTLTTALQAMTKVVA